MKWMKNEEMDIYKKEFGEVLHTHVIDWFLERMHEDYRVSFDSLMDTMLVNIDIKRKTPDYSNSYIWWKLAAFNPS